MKINWGHKLVFFNALFMLFVAFLVYKISTQKIDLVDKQYYEKGVKYQEEINKFAAANAVLHSISFVNGNILFKANVKLLGTMHFYRPNDATLDFEIPFATDEKGAFLFNTNALKKGNWHVRFEWKLHNHLMASSKKIQIK